MHWPSKCSKDNIDLSKEITLFQQDLPGISHSELYEATFLQIQKDFAPHLTIQRPELGLSANSLFELVFAAVSEVLEKQPQTLASILYRIDLHEGQLKREKEHVSAENMIQFISEKILRKEAQKVWLRKTLS